MRSWDGWTHSLESRRRDAALAALHALLDELREARSQQEQSWLMYEETLRRLNAAKDEIADAWAAARRSAQDAVDFEAREAAAVERARRLEVAADNALRALNRHNVDAPETKRMLLAALGAAVSEPKDDLGGAA